MPGRRNDVVEEIRARLDIVDVVAEYVALKRTGKNYIALCPFHAEDTPSFTVSPDKQMFYCFGCHAGGDIFTFIMKKEGVEFREAVTMLARRAGVALPDRRTTPAQEARWQARSDMLAVLDKAASYFEKLLRLDPRGQQARKYLAQRGIQAETAKAFRLGWAGPGWTELLLRFRKAGVSEETLLATGLVVRNDRGNLFDRFRGRLIFPITDEAGRVIGFGGRAMSEAQQPKYLNSPETTVFHKRRVLYGLDQARAAIRQTGKVLIVEGYMDAITAHQAGVTFTVASLGTALSEDQVRRLVSLAEQVYVAYDADAAGQQATLRGLEQFSIAAPDTEVYIVPLPAGEDPDSFIRQHGVDAFMAQMEKAQSLLDYVFDQFCRRYDASRAEGKAKIVASIAPWLSRLQSAVLLSEYIRRFAELLDIDEAALRVELRKQGEKSRDKKKSKQEWRPLVENGHKPQLARHTINVVRSGSLIQHDDRGIIPGHLRAERELLRIMVNCPEQVVKLADRITVDDFTDTSNKAIASAVFRIAAGRDNVAGTEFQKNWAQRLFAEISEPGARQQVGQWLFEGLPDIDVDAVVSGCIEYIHRHRAKRRSAELWRAIAECERRGQEVPESWLVEYQNLQQVLRR